MIHNKRFLLISLTIILVVGIASIFVYIKRNGPYYLPDISLNTINNEAINPALLKGSPVLVTFWASTCPECVREIPDFIKLHNDYHAKGLKILGIIIYYDKARQARAMVANKEIPYIIIDDKEKAATYAFGNVHVAPTTFLASADGRIIYRKRGKMDLKKVRSAINEMVNNGS